MYIDIENADNTFVEGFSYTNKRGNTEFVKIHSNTIVRIKDSSEDSVEIYTEDVPKLIKALQAAYNHINKE